MAGVQIREPRSDELPGLVQLELAAGAMFHEVGMPEIAADDPGSVEWLARHVAAGVVRVATDADDVPVAYLVAVPVDGALHVEQVSVHPRVARRGVGSDLLDHVAGVAAGRGLAALTLTTFTDVPWNAPYYERLGFRVVPEPAWTPGVRRIVAREVAHGLDRWPRVVMRRPV
jgi:GNAT superfamily N-acetyltransferase